LLRVVEISSAHCRMALKLEIVSAASMVINKAYKTYGFRIS
jgi:hypothetical protein